MLIEITDHKTIEYFQQKFPDCFSMLKIEFYDQPYQRYEDSEEKTGSFKSELREKYGLPVQLLRKQFGKWLPTNGTDQLTLGEQQKLALLQTIH